MLPKGGNGTSKKITPKLIELYELDRWDALVAAAAAEDAGVDPGAWLREANARHLDALADSTFDDQ